MWARATRWPRRSSFLPRGCDLLYSPRGLISRFICLLFACSEPTLRRRVNGVNRGRVHAQWRQGPARPPGPPPAPIRRHLYHGCELGRRGGSRLEGPARDPRVDFSRADHATSPEASDGLSRALGAVAAPLVRRASRWQNPLALATLAGSREGERAASLPKAAANKRRAPRGARR